MSKTLQYFVVAICAFLVLSAASLSHVEAAEHDGEEDSSSIFPVVQEEKIVDNVNGTRFGSFDWSPDGEFIVFTQLVGNATGPFGEASTLWTMNSDGEGLEKVEFSRDINVYDPRISPSNESVLFLGSYVDETSAIHYDIFRYDMTERKLTQITDSREDYSNVGSFDWMNINNIVYSETSSGSNNDQFKLWLADSEGNKERLIYEGEMSFGRLDISPDGSKIAAIHLASQGEGVPPLNELIIFDIEKNEMHRVGGNYSPEFCNVVPRWGPNSELVLYSRSACYPAPGGQIRITSVDGSFDEILFGSSNAPIGAAPSPDGMSVVFGVDDDLFGTFADVSGIYRVELGKAIPEFPVTVAAVTASSIGGMVALHRLRDSKKIMGSTYKAKGFW